LEAVERLMESNFSEPLNIGSEEIISINDLVTLVSSFENKNVRVKHIDGPQGVRGRTSDNNLMKKELLWNYSGNLKSGMEKTYNWILQQLNTEQLN